MKKKKSYIKRHKMTKQYVIMNMVRKMKVKVFDESHEKDLEDDINNFITEKETSIIDIKYSISNSIYSEEQIYCFSALIIYEENNT